MLISIQWGRGITLAMCVTVGLLMDVTLLEKICCPLKECISFQERFCLEGPHRPRKQIESKKIVSVFKNVIFSYMEQS